MITREETLSMLSSLVEEVENMSEDELDDFLMNNSYFREEVENEVRTYLVNMAVETTEKQIAECPCNINFKYEHNIYDSQIIKSNQCDSEDKYDSKEVALAA